MDDLYVLIVDDGRDERFYDLLFDQDAEARATLGLEGRLRRYDVVRSTPQAGRAAVIEALNDGTTLDVILLDHVLSSGGPAPQPVRSGVGLMREIRDEYAARDIACPACVLWTAEYSPGLACAFVEAGGRHAFSHTAVQADVVAGLWEIAAGRLRWEHTWTPPKLELTPTEAQLLPYLEADWPNHRIAAALSAPGGPAMTEQTVQSRRRSVREKVNALREQMGLDPLLGTNPTTSIADFAMEHGHVWVPLEWRGSAAG